MSERAFDLELMRRTAENYQRYFVPRISTPVAADLIATADLRHGERILDTACGTGVVTRLAIDQVTPGGTVAGLDPNPAMLAVARALGPPDVSIDWHEGRAEDLPFRDGSFDAVLCGMGLQFVSDRAAALREFHRVLVPGGRLAANVPGPTPPLFETLADGLARHVGPESAAFVHAVFSLHDPDDLRDVAAQAGFEGVEIRSSEIQLDFPPPAEFLWQYVWSTPLAAAVARVDEERRVALENEFSAECRPLAPVEGLACGVLMTTLLATKPGDADGEQPAR
jgi:ubiquinone/menaquinone biosynthesis C-methylase UbiE